MSAASRGTPSRDAKADDAEATGVAGDSSASSHARLARRLARRLERRRRVVGETVASARERVRWKGNRRGCRFDSRTALEAFEVHGFEAREARGDEGHVSPVDAGDGDERARARNPRLTSRARATSSARATRTGPTVR